MAAVKNGWSQYRCAGECRECGKYHEFKATLSTGQSHEWSGARLKCACGHIGWYDKASEAERMGVTADE